MIQVVAVRTERAHPTIQRRTMQIESECAIVVLATPSQPVLGQSQVGCATSKVTITNTPGGISSTSIEEHLTFLTNDEVRTIAFSDGRQLRINRFEPSWISAADDGVRYEFNRSDGTLSYAGSAAEGCTTTTIVGTGQCEIVPTKT
jgi:hypothetical protein